MIYIKKKRISNTYSESQFAHPKRIVDASQLNRRQTFPATQKCSRFLRIVSKFPRSDTKYAFSPDPFPYEKFPSQHKTPSTPRKGRKSGRGKSGAISLLMIYPDAFVKARPSTPA